MLTNRFANILKMSNNFEKTSFHKDPKVFIQLQKNTKRFLYDDDSAESIFSVYSCLHYIFV